MFVIAFIIHICVFVRMCTPHSSQACLAIRNLASDGKLSTSTPCAFLSNSYLFSFFPPPPSLPLFCSLPSADENQKRIVDYGGLDVLVPLLRSSDTETVTAAVAALRNLSIHNGNEVSRKGRWCGWVWYCLLYTSDAADE